MMNDFRLLAFEGIQLVAQTGWLLEQNSTTAPSALTAFRQETGIQYRFQIERRPTEQGALTVNSISGFSGYSGIGSPGGPGGTGLSGLSGYSGASGASGTAGSGESGYSGYSGSAGAGGFSGFSGEGLSGFSGYSGYSGTSGFSGSNGSPGTPGASGFSGYSGVGTSGFSGSDGLGGLSGTSGFSGFSGAGQSGFSGFSGYSGIGSPGVSGFSGFSGSSGFSGGDGGAIVSTAGVGTSPTANGTQQITHGLGKTPTIIRIYGIGAFVSNAAATPTPFSMGIWNSSGNRCVYMRSTGTTSQASQASSTFAIFVATSSGNNISGVIQNVGPTTFDIVWTETGTAAAQNFMWEAE